MRLPEIVRSWVLLIQQTRRPVRSVPTSPNLLRQMRRMAPMDQKRPRKRSHSSSTTATFAQGLTEPVKIVVSEPKNLLGLDRSALQNYFASLGEKAFHARQVLQWVYQRGVTDFSKMTDLRLSLRQTLSECAVISLPEVSRAQHSEDGTRKWVVSTGGW